MAKYRFDAVHEIALAMMAAVALEHKLPIFSVDKLNLRQTTFPLSFNIHDCSIIGLAVNERLLK